MVGFNLQLLLAGKLLLLMLIGVAARKLNVISGDGKRVLTDLVLYLLLPCSILKSFMVGHGAESIGEIGEILAASIGFQALSIFLSRILYRRCEKEHQKALSYATIVPNSGILGTPVAEGLFGAEGAMLASVYLVPMRLCMWTFGLSIFTKARHGGTLKKALTHPCILAALLGFIFLLFNVKLPALLSETLELVGGSNTAISMILVGSIIADMDRRMMLHRDVFYFTLLRLVAIPLTTYGLSLLFGLAPMVRNVCVVLTAMPAGSTASILALKYGGNEYFASAIIAVTTVLSMIALPIWCAVLA